jgi:hypothetical protein
MSFTYPFGWDQGLFAWAGGVIVQGGMPYVNAWDIKGPLVHYIYASAQALFGAHLWSIRIVDAALLCVATLSVARVASSLTDHAAGRWAAILFFLWYGSHSYWHTAQPDGWAGMLLIIALVPLLSPRSASPALALTLAGFSVGIMTLLKPMYLVFLLLPTLRLIMMDSAARTRHCCAIILGWLLPIGLTLGWFASQGALGELIEVYIKYSSVYAALSSGDRLRGLVEYLLSARVVSVGLPIIVYGGYLLWFRHRPAAMILVVWIALVIFLVVLQNRYYAYHWLPMIPAVAILGTVGFSGILSRGRTLGYVIGAVTLIHCVTPILLEEIRFVGWMSGRVSRADYYAAYGGPGDEMKAVQWLNDQGKPGTVFVFGWHSGVAWLSGRQTVSRFGYSLPLVMGDGLKVQAQYRAELLDELKSAPPRYMLVGTQSQRIVGKTVTLADFPELESIIQRDYRQVAHFGSMTIHEIRS